LIFEEVETLNVRYFGKIFEAKAFDMSNLTYDSYIQCLTFFYPLHEGASPTNEWYSANFSTEPNI
jgi:hypothetical protein